MQRVLKIALVIMLIFAGITIVLNFIYDYPEKFKLKKANIYVFQVDEKSPKGCYNLTTNINTDKQNQILVGIQFEIDYVNDNYFGLNKIGMYIPAGSEGHTDSLKNIEITISENETTEKNISSLLGDATSIEYFQVDSEPVVNHDININNNCNIASKIPSIDAFVRLYNSRPESIDIFEIDNLFLFKIDHETYLMIKDKKITTRINKY